MNRLVLAVLLAIFATNEYTNGQILEPWQSPDKKWGFVEDLAAVWLNGKGGFIGKNGMEIIPLKYGEVSEFSEGLAKVTFNGKYGFIDKADKVVIPFEYDMAYGFSERFGPIWGPPEGFAMVVQNEKYGVFDKTGKEIVPVKYTRDKAMRKLNRHLKR